jgi:hypothetical protein
MNNSDWKLPEDFFEKHLGYPGAPQNFQQWLHTPEYAFAEVINGIQQFLAPVWDAIVSDNEHIQRWSVSARCWK